MSTYRAVVVCISVLLLITVHINNRGYGLQYNTPPIGITILIVYTVNPTIHTTSTSGTPNPGITGMTGMTGMTRRWNHFGVPTGGGRRGSGSRLKLCKWNTYYMIYSISIAISIAISIDIRISIAIVIG